MRLNAVLRQFGNISATPGSNPLSAPVITLTSATGTNPPTWSSVMADLQDGDTIQLDFTSNGSAPDGTAEESHTADTTEEYIIWSTFAGFAGGATVKWRIRYGRNPGTGFVWSDWSNTLTDTMSNTFAPSQLYGVGDIGYAWDTTDYTKVYADNGGVTNLVGLPNGTVVGRLQDVSGLSNHLNSPANNGSRPVSETTVANGLIKFNGGTTDTGASRLRSIGGFYAKGAMTLIMAIKETQADADNANMFWAEVASGSSAPVYAPGTRTNINQDVLNYIRNDSNSTVRVASMDTNICDDVLNIYVMIDTGTQVKVSKNAGAFVTDTYTRSGSLTTNRSTLGCCEVAGTTIFSAAITGYIGCGIAIGRALAGTLTNGGGEIANAYNWVAAKHGLTQL